MRVTYRSTLPAGADVIIVGGGISGAATAFHASKAGLHPVLLEGRSALCTLTTGVAAGGYRLQLESEEEYRLVRESLEMFLHFRDVTRQQDYDAAVRRCGYLWLTTNESRAVEQRRLVLRQSSWGLDDVDVLSGDEVRGAFPFIGPDVVQARFRAGDGVLDPKAVGMGFALASGADVVTDCRVLGFAIAGERVVGVETTRGRIDGDAIVVAAGPFSAGVCGMARLDLPLQPIRRHKLVMPDVPQVPPSAPMTIDDDTGAHWRPLFGGAAVLFPDPNERPSPPADDVPVDHRFAFQVLDPSSVVSVSRVTPFWREVWEAGSAHWMLQAGQYTMTPDRRPLIGPTALEGLFVNTGCNGHGVMTAPAGARRLIDLVMGRTPAADNPFRIDRPFERHEPAGLL